MTNFEKLKNMSKEELINWLDEIGKIDDAPWVLWFTKKYCDNCEPIIEFVPLLQKECECTSCEINDKCKFFPEKEKTLSSTEVIELWLNEEINDGK